MANDLLTVLDAAPNELRVCIMEFWPSDEWEHAASVAKLESGWDAFALNDTTSAHFPCGSELEMRGGVRITAERSVGYFQINACNLPADWEWQRLYNARHNCGTAHMLWEQAGKRWSPWYFSATNLNLI